MTLNCVFLIKSVALSKDSLESLLQRRAKQVINSSLCPSEIKQKFEKSRIPQTLEEIECIKNEIRNY